MADEKRAPTTTRDEPSLWERVTELLRPELVAERLIVGDLLARPVSRSPRGGIVRRKMRGR